MIAEVQSSDLTSVNAANGAPVQIFEMDSPYSSRRLTASSSTSKLIAGLMGPTLVAIAAAILLNLASLPELAEQISRDPA
jgi:hypothetical protein